MKIKKDSSCKIIVSSKAGDSIDNGYTELQKGTTYITRQISRLGKLIEKKICIPTT